MKQRPIALLGLALAVITLLAGLSYFLCQQLQRQNANDPQIQIAEDASEAFTAGQPVPTMDQAGSQIDIAKSLSTFIIIYNATGTAVFSTGLLNNAVPAPPNGIFDWVKAHGQDRVTWQPTKDVRIAAVLMPYSASGQSGTVLVGRSLREVEKRDNMLLLQVAIGWAILMILTILGTIYISMFSAISSPFKPRENRPMPPTPPTPAHPEHVTHHDATAAPIITHDHSSHEHMEHRPEHHAEHTDTPQI